MKNSRTQYNYTVTRGSFDQPVENIIPTLEGRELISTETYHEETACVGGSQITRTVFDKYGERMVAFQVVSGDESGYDTYGDYFSCPIEKQPGHKAILGLLKFS